MLLHVELVRGGTVLLYFPLVPGIAQFYSKLNLWLQAALPRARWCVPTPPGQGSTGWPALWAPPASPGARRRRVSASGRSSSRRFVSRAPLRCAAFLRHRFLLAARLHRSLPPPPLFLAHTSDPWVLLLDPPPSRQLRAHLGALLRRALLRVRPGPGLRLRPDGGLRQMRHHGAPGGRAHDSWLRRHTDLGGCVGLGWLPRRAAGPAPARLARAPTNVHLILCPSPNCTMCAPARAELLRNNGAAGT